jgi:hypothetical protein
MVQAEEHITSKHEVLSSDSIIVKKEDICYMFKYLKISSILIREEVGPLQWKRPWWPELLLGLKSTSKKIDT